MITLITGEPGNGKTAYAMCQILVEFQKKPRPLFLWGIKDVNLAYQVAPPLREWTKTVPVPEDPSLIQDVFTFPPGSLIVIDECQNVFRVRASSAKVPPHVAALETHRHTGVDFWLITQKPQLIDSNVRNLIGKHIHLRSSWSGRRLYEWPECRNPAMKSDLADAAQRAYKLPSHVFTLYTSATQHLEVKRRLPKQLYLLVALLVVVVGLGAHLYMRMQTVWQGDEPNSAHEEKPPGLAAGGRASGHPQPALVAQSQQPITSAGTWRLVSFVFARAGERQISRYWMAEDNEGNRRKIEGDSCTGEGTDARCIMDGQLVMYRRKPPGFSVPPKTAKIDLPNVASLKPGL